MRVSVICPVYSAHYEELSAAVRSVLDQEGGEECSLI